MTEERERQRQGFGGGGAGMGGAKHQGQGQPAWLMMKAISGLNQVHVNSRWRPVPRTVVVKRQRQYGKRGGRGEGGKSLSAFPSTAACRLFIVTWSSACPPSLPPSLAGDIPVTAASSSSPPHPQPQPRPSPLCQVTRLVCSDGTEEEMKARVHR